ncbi:MAG: hypothetical protein RI963_2922 [Planctomycetota bacterium]|jgi:hypothetical protein
MLTTKFSLPQTVTRTIRSLALLVIGSIVGCGGGTSLTPAEGDVSVDGKAVEGVVLLFHPDSGNGPVTSAVSDAAGHFKFTTDAQPGIPSGKYQITAMWPEPLPPNAKISMSGPPDQPDLLKGRYAARVNSKMTADIKSDTKTIPKIELTTK